MKPFTIKSIKSLSTIKTLLATNIMSLDIGIDWDDIDWDNRSVVSNVMEKVIKVLESDKC